jgi:hypothetical protein
MAKFCSSCGAELEGAEKFCVKSGIKQAESAPLKKKSNKSRTAIITVCIFAVFFVGGLLAFPNLASTTGGNTPVSNGGSGNTSRPSGSASTTQPTNDANNRPTLIYEGDLDGFWDWLNEQSDKYGDESWFTDWANEYMAEIFGWPSEVKWPANLLPAGTPVYTDGTISYVDNNYGQSVSIDILDTSFESLVKYVDVLNKAGWSVEITGSDAYGHSDRYIIRALYFEHNSRLNLVFEPDGGQVGETTDMGPPEIKNGTTWPTAYLPADTPVFPANAYVVNAWPDRVEILVKGITNDMINEYILALKSAGWETGYGSGESKYSETVSQNRLAFYNEWVMRMLDTDEVRFGGASELLIVAAPDRY